MLERFSDSARRVLVLAQEEARLLGHPFVGTEHLLLGLLREGEGVAAKALDELDIILELAREKVDELVGTVGGVPVGSPAFTPRAKLVLELALKEALDLGHLYIGTEHILLGLLREEGSVAATALVSLGVDLAEVRETVLKFLGGAAMGHEGRGVRLGGLVVNVPTGPRLVMCSFCGRRPPDTGRVVESGWAVICQHCIEEWHERLASSDEEPGPAPEAHLVEPPPGPPPEEERP